MGLVGIAAEICVNCDMHTLISTAFQCCSCFKEFTYLLSGSLPWVPHLSDLKSFKGRVKTDLYGLKNSSCVTLPMALCIKMKCIWNRIDSATDWFSNLIILLATEIVCMAVLLGFSSEVSIPKGALYLIPINILLQSAIFGLLVEWDIYSCRHFITVLVKLR